MEKVISNPNKMHHLFGQEKHGFDGIVAVERLVGGSMVHVDGMVVSDIPRISTAWVMP